MRLCARSPSGTAVDFVSRAFPTYAITGDDGTKHLAATCAPSEPPENRCPGPKHRSSKHTARARTMMARKKWGRSGSNCSDKASRTDRMCPFETEGDTECKSPPARFTHTCHFCQTHSSFISKQVHFAEKLHTLPASDLPSYYNESSTCPVSTFRFVSLPLSVVFCILPPLPSHIFIPPTYCIQRDSSPLGPT